MAYTTQAKIEAFLKRSLTTPEVSLLPTLLGAIDAWINYQIGTSFVSTPTTKYYEGSRESVIDIDACTNITKVALVNDENEELHVYTVGEEYLIGPRNSAIKTYISRRRSIFPNAAIAVTASFGLGEAVPDDISYLATYLAGKLLSESVNKNLKSESIEGYSRAFSEFKTTDEIVIMALSKYNTEEIFSDG